MVALTVCFKVITAKDTQDNLMVNEIKLITMKPIETD